MLSATLSTIFVAFYNGAARHSVAIDKLSVAAVVRGAVEGKEDIMVAWAQMTALARCRTAVLVGLRLRDDSTSWLWSSDTS